MSISIYDKALLEKVKYWTSTTDMHVYGPGDSTRLFETIGDLSEDAPIKLPIVVVSHRGGYTIDNPNKTPLTFDAKIISRDKETRVVAQLNAVPITIPYQLDVYTKYQKDTSEYIRNFVFNIVNYPVFKVVVPYGGMDYSHNAKMRLANVIEDNSDIPERLIKGQFSRMSLQIDVDDAYLWDVKKREPVSISFDGIRAQGLTDDPDDFIEENI